MRYRFGPGSLVIHKDRLGLVVSKHGKVCPWYRVEFHLPMPSPSGPVVTSTPEPGPHAHAQPAEWHYEVSLAPLTNDWGGSVPASLLRRIRGFLVMDLWLRGYCFGRKQGFEAGKFANRPIPK